MKPAIVYESQMPADLDQRIRDGLCSCFPADRAVFSRTRAWHGSAPLYSVVLLQTPPRPFSLSPLLPFSGEKGDSPHLPERPEGCFAQMGTVPFFPPSRVLAHAGIVQRTITAGGCPLRVAGVQNVFVLPEFRRQGLSGRVLQAGMEEAGSRGFDCGLLFCVPPLETLYAACGWTALGPREIVRTEEGRRQPLPGENVAMFYPLGVTTFPGGLIDLCGNDW
jgi:GNAT superfamily N-acetyltransferase